MYSKMIVIPIYASTWRNSEKAPGEDAPRAATGEASGAARELSRKNADRTNRGSLHFRVTL